MSAHQPPDFRKSRATTRLAGERAGIARRACVVVGLWLLTLATAAPAPAPAATAFDQANHLYEQGRYEEAVRTYEDLLHQGIRTAAVLYNRGNAWFKAGHLGRAIASYHEALELAPRDPEIRANLQFVREQVRPPSFKPGTLQQWLTRLTVNEWTLAAAVPFWISLLLLMAGQVRPAWRARSMGLLWCTGLLTLFLAALTLAAHLFWQYRRPAVVITATAPLRNGPFEESPVLLQLHDGAEVLVLERKDNWLRVTPDGIQSGWVPQDALWIPATL